MRGPARVLVSGQVLACASDREFPASTERSGTLRARHPQSCTTVEGSAPWCSTSPRGNPRIKRQARLVSNPSEEVRHCL
jgi:hypothetical protein